MDALTSQQILDSGLIGWQEEDGALHAAYAIVDYRGAAAFITEIAQIADIEDHHPDLRLYYGAVEVAMCTHSGGPKVTRQDIEMAQRISGVAARLGLTPKHASGPREVSIAPPSGVEPPGCQPRTASTDPDEPRR